MNREQAVEALISIAVESDGGATSDEAAAGHDLVATVAALRALGVTDDAIARALRGELLTYRSIGTLLGVDGPTARHLADPLGVRA